MKKSKLAQVSILLLRSIQVVKEPHGELTGAQEQGQLAVWVPKGALVSSCGRGT